MKWLPTAGITDLRFKIKTLTGKHELTGKKGKIMYKYDAKSLKAEEFINDEEIRETLAYADANKDNVELIDAIIAKARERKGLNHREASVLLACQIPEKISSPCSSRMSAMGLRSGRLEIDAVTSPVLSKIASQVPMPSGVVRM